MVQSLVILDNFYQDPDNVRQFALSQEYNIIGNYPGRRSAAMPSESAKNITFDGNTYIASSLFLGSSESAESSEVSVSNLVVKFGGADQTIISLFLNNDYMDKRAWVYRGFLDENQALINYPFLLFDGRIENMIGILFQNLSLVYVVKSKYSP